MRHSALATAPCSSNRGSRGTCGWPRSSLPQEKRIAGGLLYGRWFADEQGAYLVVNGYLEAGPGENRGDRISRSGQSEFTLTDPDLRLLRRDARRTYTSSVEAGWWRSLPGPGVFGPRDFETQRALVGPGGAGLLVFGSGLDWGTAYLGPDAVAPSPTELLPEVRLVPSSPDAVEPTPQRALDAEPDLIDDLGFDVEPDLDAGPAFDDLEDDVRRLTTTSTTTSTSGPSTIADLDALAAHRTAGAAPCR